MDQQKLLSEFGKKYTDEVYTKGIAYAMSFLDLKQTIAPCDQGMMDKILPVIERLTPDEVEGFRMLFKQVILSNMFSTMKLFDTNEEYQLIYSNGNKEINLREVAEDNDYGNGFLYGEVFNWIKD